jgi:hypothetical protein
MKKILIIIFFSLSFYSSYASDLILTRNASDTAHIDSIYQTLLKMNFDTYVGQSLSFFLDHLDFKNYDFGYHEEPTLRLDHITISYGSDLGVKIYFDCLEYVPRYSSPVSDRTWMNSQMIIHEKVSRLELVNYKIKPYPFYIKSTKKGKSR